MRRAKQDDKENVVDILHRSFDNNRSVNYVVKQDDLRLERIKRLMQYSFDIAMEFGDVWISDNEQACALIVHPDRKRKTTFRTLLQDAKLITGVIGVSGIRKVLKRERMIHINHPKIPIAHLWFVGVEPEVQGKGIGTAFMQEIITECKRLNRPVYLETSVEQNLSFYRNLGFAKITVIQLGYPLHVLRRVW